MPWLVLACQSSKWNGHTGIIIDEPGIKMSEPEEGLDFVDPSRGRQIADDLSLRFIHLETVRAADGA